MDLWRERRLVFFVLSLGLWGNLYVTGYAQETATTPAPAPTPTPAPAVSPTTTTAAQEIPPPSSFDSDTFITNRKPETPYKVTKVLSGNLLLLDSGDTIRLLGVKTSEDYEAKAFKFLKQLLEGKEVRLEFQRRNRDVHGHLLATVFKDDLCVNKLLKEDAAYYTESEPTFSYTPSFLDSVSPKRKAVPEPWEFLLGEEKKPEKIAEIKLKNKLTIQGELIKETKKYIIIKRKFHGLELVKKKDIKSLIFK